MESNLMPKWIKPKEYQDLYNLGYSDSAIAAKLQCSKSAVYKWRKRAGLVSNLAINPLGMLVKLNPFGSYDHICILPALRDKLGWQSEDTLQLTIIGDVLRIEKAQNRETQEKKIINSNEAMRLYNQGYSDKRIAKALDVMVHSVSGWRYRRNLPPNRSINQRIDESEAERLYSLRYNDLEIAGELGIERNVVYRWRKRTVRI